MSAAFEAPSPRSSAEAAPGAERSSETTTARRLDRLAALVGAIALAGLAIRLALARGPLWYDEIWSIDNLAPLTHFWQVFWGVSHDNNHFLNSLWLYLVTPLTRDDIALRAPSILMGAATILLMAKVARRHSAAAAVAAAVLTAVSYFFVNCSTEARGYAGCALALVVAFDAMERSIEDGDAPARLTLAAAAGLGALWHLAAAPALGLFALIGLIGYRRRLGASGPALAANLRLFIPAAIAVLPAFAFLIAGVAVTGRFTVGGLRAFVYDTTFEAMATTIRDTIGLPPSAPTALVLPASVATIALALMFRLTLTSRRAAYAVILIALPAAVLALRPPNAHIPRYYLVAALFLVLMASELFGAAWRAGGWRRAAGALALVAAVVGNVSLLARFETSKASAWPEALARVRDSGKTQVASSFDDRVGRLISYDNETHAPAVALVRRADWCAVRPRWLIAETAGAPDRPATLEIGAPDCWLRYAFVAPYESWGLSSVNWLIYSLAP
ncbi:MAG TPA: glycosyltransferase family 39 protein [Roseiarcus sp.]|nr:glycosyltransferase family 39 protein [Roseiarcus sp.]